MIIFIIYLHKIYNFRLSNLREVHRRHELNYEAVVQELVQSEKELGEGEMRAPEMAQRYKYYQELRGYVTDLVECLDEKVGLQIRKRFTQCL